MSSHTDDVYTESVVQDNIKEMNGVTNACRRDHCCFLCTCTL